MLIVSKFPNFTCLYKDSILHHNQSTRFNQSKKGVRFQLDDLPPPTTQVYNQQSDQKPKQNKSSSLDKTQIKFQVKEAYVMKGGRKEFKNVLILCETRDGKIEIGWSNRAEDSPFRRHSMWETRIWEISIILLYFVHCYEIYYPKYFKISGTIHSFSCLHIIFLSWCWNNWSCGTIYKSEAKKRSEKLIYSCTISRNFCVKYRNKSISRL